MPQSKAPADDIDWSLTTWEGARREQLRRWAALPLERIILAIEEMDELAQRFALEHAAGEADNSRHDLETGNHELASASSRGKAPASVGAHPAQRRGEHGVRGRAGEHRDAPSRTRPRHATRYVETTLGVLSYAELAPHLARRVQALEESIEAGDFDGHAVDDQLIRSFHSQLCAELIPQLSGWRRADVTVGTHTPPASHLVPQCIREYARDLAARLAALSGEADQHLLETLAFAEGRLLSIHPFLDFNGRVARVFLRLLLHRLDLAPVSLAPNDSEGETASYLTALRATDANDWRPLGEVWRRRFEKSGL